MEWFSDILHRHGALVVFGVVFAEQLGLPLPALPLLVAAGVLIGTSHLAWQGVLLAAIFATLLADGLWYAAGQWRGRSVLSVLCRIALEPDSCIRRTERFFHRHGAPSLVVAKFIPGLSTIGPPLAGIMGLSLSAFLFFDGLGTILWVGSSLGLGYLFSDRVEQALVYAEQVTPTIALTMAGGVLGYLSFKSVARRRLLKRVSRITVEELRRKLESDLAPVVLDVRGREAMKSLPGLPGAMQVPAEELEQHLGKIPRGRELVLYCACPGDAGSSLVALRLQRLGFSQVWVLRGGLEAWRARHQQDLTAQAIPLVSPALGR